MSDLTTQAPDAVDRFETNLAAYIKSILDSARIAAQVLPVNSFETRKKGVIVEIDSHSDLSTEEMGVSQSANVAIRISGQVDKVPSKSHKAIVGMIRCGLWDIRPDVRLLHASQSLLDAINACPGQIDSRPQSSVHLWDFRDPSSSAEGRDATADTILSARAKFSPWDWNGESRYGA